MNEMKKSNINALATQHIATQAEADFEATYRSLYAEYQAKLTYWSTTTSLSGSHDMQALFDDAFISTTKAIAANGGDFVKLFHRSLHNRYNSLLRKLMVRRKYEQYEMDNGDEDTAMFEIASEFNLEDEINAKKRADQRQLIDSLLSDADETTTAIVATFLQHPKPTPTAIGKALGLHHSVVIRKLERLAGKFDARQHGEHRDYLVAL
jgi:hypothetical protein